VFAASLLSADRRKVTGVMSEHDEDERNEAWPEGEPMPISMAGSRTRLEHYQRERRNGLLAALGLLFVGSLVVWAIYRFVNS